MKVLVTGATGFVGSHVVDALRASEHDVSFIARSTSNLRWLEGSGAVRVDGSLFDVGSLRAAVADVDIIIHVAGLTAAKNEAEFRKGNRDATKNLLDAVRAYRPQLQRFVHISSGAVVGPSPSPEQAVDERSPLHPITAYGRTKKEAEDEVIAAGGDIPFTIVRPPAVYGPRDSAILTFFQSVARGIAPIIGFDEKQVSLIHARDLARGIVLAASSPAAVGQTYFITSERFYTWPHIAAVTAAVMGRKSVLKPRLPHALVLGIAGIVGALGKLAGKPPVLDYEKGIDITRPYWVFSPEKARRELGFREQLTLEEGIRETVTWYRDRGWL